MFVVMSFSNSIAYSTHQMYKTHISYWYNGKNNKLVTISNIYIQVYL